jgi:hypothetical protein
VPERLFRKRPVVVSAIQWTGENLDELRAFLGDAWIGQDDSGAVLLPTLHGPVPAEVGAWICRGLRDFWPVEVETFAMTYEPVEAVAGDA